MLRRLALILVPLSLLSTGCHWLDPLREADRAPCAPSVPYAPAMLLDLEPTSSAAAGDLDGQTLDLAECIVISLERNPQTRIAWQTARSQAFQVGQTKSTLWPQASLIGDARRTDLIRDRNRGQSPRSLISGSFGVRYLMLDGGGRKAQVRGAEADLMAANFQHNTVLLDVALSVELAYQQRLAAMALVEVATENLRRGEYNVKLAEARLKSGVSAKFDVLTAETERANAELALVRARNLERVTQGQLARAMGVHVSESFEIEDLPSDIHQEEMEDIERLLAEAQQRRPELQTALARIASGEAAIDAVQAEYRPKLSALANYGGAEDTYAPGGDDWTLGLSVELPLFTGFSRNYRQAKAWSDYELAAAQYENTAQDIGLEVWTAHSRVIEAGEAIEAAEALVVSADESLRVAEGRYRAGAGNIIELINAQTSQTDARTQRVRAVLGWYTAMAQFQRTIGQTMSDASPEEEAP